MTDDIQWTTAGSGIIHQQRPNGDRAGRANGFQLWANLPAALKMISPNGKNVVISTGLEKSFLQNEIT